jgi:hypothetical protein
MNKIVAIVLGLVVLGGIVYFAMANRNSTEPVSTQKEQKNTETTPTSNVQKSSLKNLVAQGNQQCTYQDGQTSGTVYTSNGKARMDFTSVANGVSMSSHSIIDSDTYYAWVDGQTTGFKISINQTAQGSVGSNQNVDVNRTMDYNCSSWSPDNSKFSLPTGITFTDMSSFKLPSQ